MTTHDPRFRPRTNRDTYPRTYHLACRLLIEHGTFPESKLTAEFCRECIARALWAIRKEHGPQRARSERARLSHIAPFPGKEQS